jgi:hypothetical protein
MSRTLLLPLGPVTASTFTAWALVALASHAIATPVASSPHRLRRAILSLIRTPFR